MAQAYENAIDVLEIDSTSTKLLSREKYVNQFARITQFTTWPILFFLFRTLFEIRIEGRETLDKVRSPFIIVANHTSFYDSFLFRLVLGWNTPHLPLRFMAVNRFDSKLLNFLASIGFIDFVYSLFGVFTVTPGLGIDKNIEKAKQIVSVGGNIVIYPEGRITKDGSVGQFKNGAAALFKKTGVNIIPVSFRRCKCKIFRKIIFINVGKILDIDRSLPIQDITNIFYKVITKQHAKGKR